MSVIQQVCELGYYLVIISGFEEKMILEMV